MKNSVKKYNENLRGAKKEIKPFLKCLSSIEKYATTIQQLKESNQKIIESKESGYRTIFLGYDTDKKEIVLSMGSGRKISINRDGYINFDYYEYKNLTIQNIIN